MDFSYDDIRLSHVDFMSVGEGEGWNPSFKAILRKSKLFVEFYFI